MGMKRKRLVYVKKFGKKFGAWLAKCRPAPKADPKPAPEPVAKPAPKEEKE